MNSSCLQVLEKLRSKGAELDPYDSEIERTIRKLRKVRKQGSNQEAVPMGDRTVNPNQTRNEEERIEENVARNNVVDQRALKDYSSPTLEGSVSSIRRPPIPVNNFEIKPAIIQMIQHSIQFGGLSSDDPNLHIASFLELCDTFKHNGVSDDAIRLRLFPFSLRDKAKAWLISLPPGGITTWDQLVSVFLAKYFQPVKSAKMRSDITNFYQQDMESLYEAWERYKDLLRKCPHHGLPIWLQVQTFYNGLIPNTQVMVDAASGGALNNKTPEEAYNLIEVMASNNYMKSSDRNASRRVAGVHEIDNYTALSAQLAAIQKQLGVALKVNAIETSSSSLICDFCAGNHASGDCQVGNPFAQQEQANYVSNFQRGQGNPYSNTYNPGWRNHPNFSWGNNNNEHKQPPGFQQQQKRSNMENVLTKFMEESGKRFEKNELLL